MGTALLLSMIGLVQGPVKVRYPKQEPLLSTISPDFLLWLVFKAVKETVSTSGRSSVILHLTSTLSIINKKLCFPVEYHYLWSGWVSGIGHHLPESLWRILDAAQDTKQDLCIPAWELHAAGARLLLSCRCVLSKTKKFWPDPEVAPRGSLRWRWTCSWQAATFY